MVFGPYGVEVDPADAGRILELSLDGTNVLAAKAESPEAYGSVFWTSPQSDWVWPPPPELAVHAWAAEALEDALVLRSRVLQPSELAVTQRLFADRERGALVIVYTLDNRGGAPRKVAPWQNTRVKPGGLTFYPSHRPTTPESSLSLRPEDGIVWYRHRPGTRKENVKSLGDGEEGWLAHLDGELLFVKLFDDVPPGAEAPGEGEIEIYVPGDGRFVEVEQQGSYEELAPGATRDWAVRWILRRVPEGVEREAGSKSLLDFTRALVASQR